MTQTLEIKQEIKRLNKEFLHSSDFVVKEIMLGKDENSILCYYSSLVNKKDVEQNLWHLKQISQPTDQEKQDTATDQNVNKEKSNETKNEDNRAEQKQLLNEDSITITHENYDPKKLVDYVCNGETLIILLQSKQMIRINNAEFAHKTFMRTS